MQNVALVSLWDEKELAKESLMPSWKQSPQNTKWDNQQNLFIQETPNKWKKSNDMLDIRNTHHKFIPSKTNILWESHIQVNNAVYDPNGIGGLVRSYDLNCANGKQNVGWNCIPYLEAILL